MSVVEVDKLAISTVLIMNFSKVSVSTSTVHRFILGDDVNGDTETPLSECVASVGYCVLSIVHSDRNNGRKYYY